MTSYPVYKKRDYLGNGYSYMKSYYWALIWSWGRPFRICDKKVQKLPPSGEISMTSFPVHKSVIISETVADRNKLLLKTYVKSESAFRNPFSSNNEKPP